jgi:methylated-DNA-protein-cysteine methyltransferase-like protein
MMKDSNKAQQVWQTVKVIPEGKVAAYGQIADLAGLPGQARYVSKAMSLAPKEIFLPWHRVIKSNGQIAFEKGSKQAKLQISLLLDEGILVKNHRVNMQEHRWQPDLGELLSKLTF